MIIAVDGPTASGKGTIARALAEHFGLPVLDTGLLYRAVGYQTQLDHGDADNAADALAACDFPDSLLDDPALRYETTGGLASRVSVHPQVRAALQQVDAVLGSLFDTLQAHGQLERTNIVIVSDHGMAQVMPGQVIAVEDMVSVEEAAIVSVGQVIGVSPNPGFEAVLDQRLPGRHDHYACWRKGELPARWHYGSNARIPPIVCQMDEGWDALPAAHAAQRRQLGQVRGSHGYDPALASMHASFIAHGPAFRPGTVLPAFDNVDVYPLLAHLLQLPPEPNQGTLATLQPGLKEAVAAP